MKILQLCHKPPFPANDGGSIAMFNLCEGLRKLGHQVHILAMNTHKHYCKIEEVPEEFLQKTRYTLVDVDTRIKMIPAFVNLFTNNSYNIIRFHTKEVELKLLELLKDNSYDLIILESIFTTTYIDLIRKIMPCPIVLRSHNVEYMIWENLARTEKSFFKSRYLRLLTRRLRQYELKTIKKVDYVAAISEADINHFREIGCKIPMMYVPFGINFTEDEFKEEVQLNNEELIIFHVGSMNWIPHQEAFKWFFEQVWPVFYRNNPTAKLHLAGSDMPDWITQGHFPNVTVVNGYVDGKKYMNGKAIMIVPSFHGSGIRIKIIEGMAKGKVIITTPNGAMGIPCTHGENIFIANDCDEWVKILNECIINPELVRRISNNARKFSASEYDYETGAAQLINFTIEGSRKNILTE